MGDDDLDLDHVVHPRAMTADAATGPTVERIRGRAQFWNPTRARHQLCLVDEQAAECKIGP